MSRLARLAPLVVLLVVAGCNGGSPSSTNNALPAASSVQGQAASSAPASPAPQAATVVDQPTKEFLSVVCYTDTAVQNLNSAAVAAGGWGGLSGNDAQRYGQAAVEAAREAVRQIQENTWPDSISGQMQRVSQEYLAMLQPLEQIMQTKDAAARSAAWRELTSQDRTGEEQVRLTLKLGPVGSSNDGCPPPVQIKAVKPSPSASSAGGGSTASGAWTQHWTSPSGNIQCGYAPSGSRGLPVVACVVADQGTYMKLTQGVGVEGPLSASSSTYDQLSSSGASVLGYGQTTSAGPFQCMQSSADGIGMSCWLPATQQGFSVKRDSYVAH